MVSSESPFPSRRIPSAPRCRTRVGEGLQSVCSSVNEMACHAIPDNRQLQEGDIVSFDVSVFFKVRSQAWTCFAPTRANQVPPEPLLEFIGGDPVLALCVAIGHICLRPVPRFARSIVQRSDLLRPSGGYSDCNEDGMKI